MTGAAFFDLDRTLLRGASGPLITKALQAAGLVTDRHIPGQGLMYSVFDTIGETLPSMVMARGAALLSKGWTVDAVRAAGEEAAVELDELVTPFARPLIEDHRRAGRKVVLATTTPAILVRPLAERLGFDDVVATRYAEDDGGTYTGKLEGEFVWATGKRSAVATWARAHDVDLAESYAYSDSVYDLPLLSSVGHPHAVNPDPRLRLVATMARWPILYLDVPPGVPKLFGVEPLDLLGRLGHPALLRFARFDIAGVERIPRTGPAIVVANHRSYFDPLALGIALARVGRSGRFLGKKEVFDAPVVGQVARALGGIRVERGSGSDEPLREAARSLSAGEVVVILPQGTIPRGKAFWDTELQGRPGAARLAAMSGAPVIPIGLWGTEQVWPRSAKVPAIWNVTDPPTVRIRVGDPVTLAGQDPKAYTTRIMAAITDLLPAEAASAHEPSADEIRRMSPT